MIVVESGAGGPGADMEMLVCDGCQKRLVEAPYWAVYASWAITTRLADCPPRAREPEMGDPLELDYHVCSTACLAGLVGRLQGTGTEPQDGYQVAAYPPYAAARQYYP